MFFPINTKTALPDESFIKDIGFRSAIAASPPTWEQAREAELKRNEFDKLLAKWKFYKGPVKNSEHFAVCFEIEEDLYAVATYDHGETSVDVLDVDDVDDGLLPDIPRVSQRIAEAKTRPNDRCPCGSGRKYKRCHGR